MNIPLVLASLLLSVAPEDDSQASLTELQAAIDSVSAENREASVATIEALLSEIAGSPNSATNDVPDSVLRGWMVLVRLHLAEGDEDAAREAMDESIRIARTQTPPARAYGGAVTKLYEERKRALTGAGMASIAIECEIECEIVINSRSLTERSEEQYLGDYHVWVRALEGEADWKPYDVSLTTPDTTETITYEDPNPRVDVDPNPPIVEPPPKPVKKRLLPRAAEIVGVAVGVGLLVGGAVLLSFNDMCSNTNAPFETGSPEEECGRIYNTIPSSAAMLGVGGGLLVVSGVLLTVDEVRVGRAKAQQVMIGTRLRF